MKLRHQLFIHEIKCDIYIFFNKNDDKDKLYFTYYSNLEKKLYLTDINFEDLLYKNKIEDNKYIKIDLKDYINNNLLNIRYFYKYSKNILICNNEDNILIIDLDNKNVIKSLNEQIGNSKIISYFLIDNDNFKIYLYDNNKYTFSFYNINDQLNFVKIKEEKVEMLKDSIITFLEYYKNYLIIIGSKNDKYHFIYFILFDKLKEFKFIEDNNFKFDKEKNEKKTLKILKLNNILYELCNEGYYCYNLDDCILNKKDNIIFSPVYLSNAYDFQIFFDNNFLIIISLLQIQIFHIKSNIFYINDNIGRKIKNSYILKYNNEEYLTTLYDDYDNYNKILIWKKDEFKNKIYDIIKTSLYVIKGFYGNGNDRRINLINEGYDYDEVQGMVNCILQNQFLKANKDKLN